MLRSGGLAPAGQSCVREPFPFQEPFRMTARSIRRALERKQQKLARKTARPNAFATEAAAAPEFDTGIETDISPARLAANQANSKLSTGPRTDAGKAKTSLNAVKTALTGRTVLLPGDDAEAYEQHLAAFTEEYKPAGLRESELVQSIADTYWRLARIPALEAALFARGRLEFADLFEEHELAARPHLIDAHTFLTYEKQIRNLQLQEARLVRRREKETAELRRLQAERTARDAQHGFEFSTSKSEPPRSPQPSYDQREWSLLTASLSSGIPKPRSDF
jgi:hypothetical protein